MPTITGFGGVSPAPADPFMLLSVIFSAMGPPPGGGTVSRPPSSKIQLSRTTAGRNRKSANLKGLCPGRTGRKLMGKIGYPNLTENRFDLRGKHKLRAREVV